MKAYWKKIVSAIMIMLFSLSLLSYMTLEIKKDIIEETSAASWQKVSEMLRTASLSVLMIEVYNDEKLKNLNSSGSGFFVEWPENSGKLWIVSAGHMTESDMYNAEIGNFYYLANWKNNMTETKKLNSSDFCAFPVHLKFWINMVEGDFAVFDFNKEDLTFKPRHLKWGDSASLLPYDWVFALGAPAGVYPMATKGLIGHFNSPINWGREIVYYIAHSAPIFGGNSGGPLVNLSGEVVGINLAGIEGTNISFARSSAIMKEYMAQFFGQKTEFQINSSLDSLLKTDAEVFYRSGFYYGQYSRDIKK